MIVSRIDITFNDGSVLGAEENTRGSSKELLRPPPHVKRLFTVEGVAGGGGSVAG